MQINPQTSAAYKLLHNGVLALSRAEQQGIRIDLDYCNKAKEDLTTRIDSLEKALYDTNFYRHWLHSIGNKKPNIYSNTQLSFYLYKTKKIEPVFTTKSGQGSTDEEALTELNIPELNDLLAIRRLKKVRDTYLEAFLREQVNGFIHPSFNLHLVKTYRSSSDSPNFQNIPKRDKEAMKIVRQALFPREGHLLMEADYSGLEVRIAACFHKDPVMLRYINDTTTDMHRDMAQQLFLIDKFNPEDPTHKLLRGATKNGFVFPEFYGSWYKNCAVGLVCSWGKLPRTGKWKAGQGIKFENTYLADHLISKGYNSLEKYMQHVKEVENDFWGVRFKEYAKWKERHWKAYQKSGYIDLKTGFRCYGVMAKNDVINYPVQGSAFHCNLWALTQLDRFLREHNYDTRIIGQIHDSIVLDVHPDELQRVSKIIRRITCKELPAEWDWINVPLDVEIDIGKVDASWAEMEKMEEN